MSEQSEGEQINRIYKLHLKPHCTMGHCKMGNRNVKQILKSSCLAFANFWSKSDDFFDWCKNVNILLETYYVVSTYLIWFEHFWTFRG